MGVHVSFRVSVLLSSAIYTAVELMDNMLALFLVFWGTYINFSIVVAPLCWSSCEEIPHAQGKRNPSKMVGVARRHQRANTLKLYSQKTSQSNHTRTTALSNSLKLSHACGATQDGRVMEERFDRMWSTGEGNGKPLQYSCLENPMNSMNSMLRFSSVQFSSVVQSCPTFCYPMNCSTPGLPVHHHLPELTQTQVHRVGDAIQPSYPLSSPSLPAPNPSQYQSLFQWVNSSHKVAKVLEFQL